MTDAEMQALRAAAEKAMVPQPSRLLWRDDGLLADFHTEANPAAVLALLDRVAAAEAAAAATCDAVAVEREACAKLAASQWGNAGRNSRDREGWHNVGWNDAATEIAAAIRARGRASA